MKRNALVGAVFVAVAGLTIAPVVATDAYASTHRVAAKIATTTKVTANQIIPSTTPGKIVFTIKVRALSGTALPTGTVTLTVDAFAPVTLTLKVNGNATYTHHYKVGTHTAKVVYSGSATDASSSATIIFTVH
jgi:hypothetical protein